jgi:hypothetical protein
MQKVNWMVVGVISIVIVLLLFAAGMIMGGWGYGSGGMMSSWGNGGYGMMNNWGYSPFGWIGMLFMWLIPIGLLALAVFGVVWIVRKTGNPKPPSA